MVQNINKKDKYNQNYSRSDLVKNKSNNISHNNSCNKSKHISINRNTRNSLNIESLPIELIYNIVINLQLKDIFNLLVSNKYFFTLINQEKIIWKNLFFKYFKSNKLALRDQLSFYTYTSPLMCRKKLPDEPPINWKLKFKKYDDIYRNWENGNYESKSIEGHSGGVFTLSFKDNLMLTGSFDKLVRVWDRKNMIRIGSIVGHAGWIWSVLLERSKSTHSMIGMSSSQDATINITNLTQVSSKLYSQYSDTNNSEIDNVISLPKSKSSITPSLRLNGHVGTVWTLEPQKDLHYFYSGGSDCLIKFWNIENKESINIGRHSDVVLCLSLLKDGLLSSGSADNTIKIWDTRASAYQYHPIMTLQGHGGFVNTIDNKDNYIVSGCDDKLIRIFDIRTGKCVDTLTSHTDAVRVLKIKGDRMVSGSSDMSLKIWDTKDYNRPRHTLKGHTGSIVSLQFDDKKIVSGSLDSTIKTWNFSIKNSDSSKNSLGCSGGIGYNSIESSPIKYIKHTFQSPKI